MTAAPRRRARAAPPARRSFAAVAAARHPADRGVRIDPARQRVDAGIGRGHRGDRAGRLHGNRPDALTLVVDLRNARRGRRDDRGPAQGLVTGLRSSRRRPRRSRRRAGAHCAREGVEYGVRARATPFGSSSAAGQRRAGAGPPPPLPAPVPAPPVSPVGSRPDPVARAAPRRRGVAAPAMDDLRSIASTRRARERRRSSRFPATAGSRRPASASRATCRGA